MLDLNTLFYNNIYLMIYLSIAIAVSLFWVLKYYFESLSVEIEESKKRGVILILRDLLSDFVVLSSGWVSLYALILNVNTREFNTFDIFLALVVVISIGGYAYKLFDKLDMKE